MEKFFIRRTVGGFVMAPADRNNHPLLTRLNGGRSISWVTKVLPWESMQDGLSLLRRTAKKYGLSMQVCGSRMRPTVILRELPGGAEPEPIDVFKGMAGRYAAKWGTSDFYDEYAPRVRDAIASGKPFDTRWYGAKKAVAWARISRERTRGPILVEVSECLDDSRELVDNAFWKAAGGNAYSGSGEEALEKHGLSGEDIEAAVDEIIEQTGLAEDRYEDLYELADHIVDMMEGTKEEGGNCRESSVTLHWKSGFDRVVDALGTCEDETGKALESWYQEVVAACSAKLKTIRQEKSASCATCKHFHRAIPESRMHPEDPADCGHPKHYALLSVNKHFPFAHGCKFWEKK